MAGSVGMLYIKEEAQMQRDYERNQKELAERIQHEEEKRREALKPDWQKRIDADILKQNYNTCSVCGQTEPA